MKYGDDDMSIPIIIDTDPGIDDATAISIALSHPQFDVKMISTVNGNVGIEKTTANALKLKKFFNSSVPANGPLFVTILLTTFSKFSYFTCSLSIFFVSFLFSAG